MDRVFLQTVSLVAELQMEASFRAGSLALCSLPRVLTHFVVIRYRCFAQLSLKIQVYCEIEVSLQRRRSQASAPRSPGTTPLPAGGGPGASELLRVSSSGHPTNSPHDPLPEALGKRASWESRWFLT